MKLVQLLAGFCCLLGACSRVPENVVAKVGAEDVKTEDLRRVLARAPHGGGPEERVTRVLEQLILEKAELHRALLEGLDRDPEFLAILDRALRERLREKHVPAGSEAFQPAESAIEEYHAANLEKFRTPARIELAWVFVDAPRDFFPEKRAERRVLIEQARAAAGQPGADFVRIVSENSFDQSTRYKGGKLGWIMEGVGRANLPEALLKEAFALPEIGGLTTIHESETGFCFAKVLQKTSAGEKEPSNVRAEIAAQLAREARKAAEKRFREESLAGVPVTRYPDHAIAIIAEEGAKAKVEMPPRAPE